MPSPTTPVPNEFPTNLQPGEPRIAFIGEAPGKIETYQLTPFVGPSGQILAQAMNAAGLSRDKCFIGNLCQVRAPHDKLRTFGFFSDPIQEGIRQLKADLETFAPDLIICLGGSPLALFTDWSITKKSKIKGDRIISYHPFDLPQVSTDDQLTVDNAVRKLETTLALTPKELKALGTSKKDIRAQIKALKASVKADSLQANANRWDGAPSVTAYRGTFFRADHFLPGTLIFSTIHPAVVIREYDQYHLLKWDLAKAVKHWKGWEQPKREWEKLSFDALCDVMQNRLMAHGEIGFDIEGYVSSGVTILSFATSENYAICVPFIDRDGTRLWTSDQESTLWSLIKAVLESPSNTIIMQNAAYEMFVLGYLHGIYIANVRDTMIAQWIMLCERPGAIGLGLGFLNSLYTLEPYYKDERVGTTFDDYCSYNVKDSCTTLEIHHAQVGAIQADPDKIFQYNLYLELLPITVRMQIDGIRVDTEYLRSQAQAAIDECHQLEAEILAQVNLIAEKKGKPPMASFNINSTHVTGDRQKALYDILDLKPYKKRGAVNNSADKDALYDIAKREFGTKHGDICRMMVKCAEASKRFSNYNMGIDPDGRVRSALQAPSSETGRWASRASNTGSGKNLQTVEKAEKWGYLADEGHYLFQYDLSGADSWTLAAHCAAFGDRTMLDDLNYGLKPAKMIRYALEHGPESIMGQSRDALKKLSKLAPDDATYVGCKARWYGGSYGGGIDKTLMEIYKKSGGTVKLDRKTLSMIDDIILFRYPGIRQWQIYVQKQVEHKGRLKCASGHERIFLGDPRDSETIRTALSHEPQANTCFMTNLALLRFYYGPLNSDGLIQIKLQVHDSLIGQFPCSSLDIALPRIPQAFDNPIYIQGIEIKCPAEGAYGPSWGHANSLCYADTWEKVKGDPEPGRPLNKI